MYKLSMAVLLQTHTFKGVINITQSTYLKVQFLSQARYPDSLDLQCRGHLPLILGWGGSLSVELELDLPPSPSYS